MVDAYVNGHPVAAQSPFERRLEPAPGKAGMLRGHHEAIERAAALHRARSVHTAYMNNFDRKVFTYIFRWARLPARERPWTWTQMGRLATR